MTRGAGFWVALWGAAAAVLVVAIGVEHYLGSEGPAGGPRPPAKVADARMLPPFALAAADQVAPETAARPLFTPTRRPAPVAAAVQPTMKKGQFVLTGVTVSSGASFAFLREVATGKTKSVRKGAEVNGLQVDLVEPRRVVLRQGQETEDLLLAIQTPAKGSAPALMSGPQSGAPNLFAPGGVAMPGAPGGGQPGAQPGAQPGTRPGDPPGTVAQPAAATPTNPAATPTPGNEAAGNRRRPWMKP